MRKYFIIASAFLLFISSIPSRSFSNPLPPEDTLRAIIMFHDTTVATGKAKRMADKDSVMKYITAMVYSYQVFYFNHNTTLPDLTPYNTIILVETSYDDGGNLCLNAAARTEIINWVNTGQYLHPKFLLSIGADQGYNYSRTGAANRDTAFARGVCGFDFRTDAVSTSATSLQGVLVDGGATRPIAPPAAPIDGYWPDACSRTSASYAIYKYANRTINDSIAAISKATNKYVSVTAFQDPRYFTGGNLKPWLQALISGLRGPGPDDITLLNETVSDYSLSQNYPNPFNPVTKINFSIRKDGFVNLKVFDITGKEVAALLNGNLKSGSYSIEFNGVFLNTGIYFYSLKSGFFSETKKMILIK